MTEPTDDQAFWEQRWSRTVREHPDKVSSRPPHARLIAAAGSLHPGRALDAGCGRGADTLWLAAHGWRLSAARDRGFRGRAVIHARRVA